MSFGTATRTARRKSGSVTPSLFAPDSTSRRPIPEIPGIEKVPTVLHSAKFKSRKDFGEDKNRRRPRRGRNRPGHWPPGRQVADEAGRHVPIRMAGLTHQGD